VFVKIIIIIIINISSTLIQKYNRVSKFQWNSSLNKLSSINDNLVCLLKLKKKKKKKRCQFKEIKYNFLKKPKINNEPSIAILEM
jgi:hypothetical protein